MSKRSISTKHLLHPELREHFADLPAAKLNAGSLPGFRKTMAQMVVMGDPDAAGVIRQEVFVPNSKGPDVRALLYAPKESPKESPKDSTDGKSQRPGYLHIHGGGFVVGLPEMADQTNINIAAKLGVVVLSVDHRLSPEHAIPAPLDDCYAGLAWLHNNADEWRVDRTRIGVGGESAGGGLAAALAILARDRGEYAICHQHLTYPMLDNHTGTPEHPGDPLVGEFVWTRELNQFGWASLLGSAPPVAPQVPARVIDYKGLPPAWIFTASLDLFRDENIDYARNLLRAGVPVDFVLYAGACHGFQRIPDTSLARRFTEDHRLALARGLNSSVNFELENGVQK